jgi:hypothetical protein
MKCLLICVSAICVITSTTPPSDASDTLRMLMTDLGGMGMNNDDRPILYYADERKSVLSSIRDLRINGHIHYERIWSKLIDKRGDSSIGNLYRFEGYEDFCRFARRVGRVRKMSVRYFFTISRNYKTIELLDGTMNSVEIDLLHRVLRDRPSHVPYLTQTDFKRYIDLRIDSL